MARAGPLDELGQARAQLLHAQITFAATRGSDAPPLLLAAARRLEPLDATLARATYLDAFAAALSADRLVHGGDARDVASAVLAAEWEPCVRACDFLLDGLALLMTEGYAAGAPALKAALRSFREEPMAEEDELRWLWLACHIARALGDDVAWDELTARQVALARRTGALSLLPVALDEQVHADLFCGRLAAAKSHVAEADAVQEATGSHLGLRGAIALAVFRADEAESAGADRGLPAGRAAPRRGLLARLRRLGDPRCSTTASVATTKPSPPPSGPPRTRTASARRCGCWRISSRPPPTAASRNAPRARPRCWREIAEANDTDWALGLDARSRAMLGEGDAAEQLYREAIERLGRTRISVALGRSRLVYGEWLRREGRRVDAREQLRAAHEILAEAGMEAFAERARRELLATGETVRKRSVETIDDLTPQEGQIARLAATGHTNPEIGAQLFLSPRTVEWHLRKVFGKLGITSRRQLRTALPDGRGLAAAPV